MRGVPAILWINVSILSPLYARQNSSTSPFTGQGPPCETAAALKILGVARVIRIGFSPDLDMSLQHFPANPMAASALFGFVAEREVE